MTQEQGASTAAAGTSASAESMTEKEWQDFADNCVVALPAGGSGERMQALTDQHRSHKSALVLPNGDTMIQRTVRMYCAAGLREFVALVSYQAESVMKLLGDGSDLGATIRYSHDPDVPVGRGGAIRNALENGSIPDTKNLIVHNPDDQIVNYPLAGLGWDPASFPRDVVQAHLTGLRKGHIATAVVVEGMPYTYTGMKINDGVVEEIEMYPHVHIPAHIGVTAFSPEVYPYFLRLFDLKVPTDFESVLLPILCEERRLYAVAIPNECWIPVNDPKDLRELVQALGQDTSSA